MQHSISYYFCSLLEHARSADIKELIVLASTQLLIFFYLTAQEIYLFTKALLLTKLLFIDSWLFFLSTLLLDYGIITKLFECISTILCDTDLYFCTFLNTYRAATGYKLYS